MHSISHTFGISAAHVLPKLPKGHPCTRLHGHNWNITVTVASATLSDLGFVMDFADLKKQCNTTITKTFDHTYLNDSVPNPTCELLAEKIYNMIAESLPATCTVDMVTVEETPGQEASYYE